MNEPLAALVWVAAVGGSMSALLALCTAADRWHQRKGNRK